jgi:hypothetical protein
MLAFEMFGGLDGKHLAVAIRARRTINRDFELRAGCLREESHSDSLPSILLILGWSKGEVGLEGTQRHQENAWTAFKIDKTK